MPHDSHVPPNTASGYRRPLMESLNLDPMVVAAAAIFLLAVLIIVAWLVRPPAPDERELCRNCGRLREKCSCGNPDIAD